MKRLVAVLPVSLVFLALVDAAEENALCSLDVIKKDAPEQPPSFALLIDDVLDDDNL